MSWQPGRDPTVDLRDDAVLDQAVAARSDERLMQRVAVETATFTGTLRDLAERRAGVTVGLEADRSVQGTMLAVGSDHVVVAIAGDQHAHVRLPAIVTVRPDPASHVPIAQGSRDAADDRSLADVLSRWEADRPWLAIVVRGRSEPLRGRLAAVGEDVVTLEHVVRGHPVYVAVPAVQVVLVDQR